MGSGAHNFKDLAAFGSRVATEIGGMPSASTALISNHLPVGAGTDRGIPSLHVPTLARTETSLAAISSGADVERSISAGNSDSLHGDECNVLYVDGLPTDCTRREVGRILIALFYYISTAFILYFSIFRGSLMMLVDLFRPFMGFKDIRLYHKEPRRVC